MSTETLDVTGVVSNPPSWTAGAPGSVAEAISDNSDATYARSNTANQMCKFACADPGAVIGQLVAVCPWVRAKKDGTKAASVAVLGYYGKKYPQYVATGFALAIPHAAAAANFETAAHNGLHDFTYLGPGGEQDAAYAGIGLVDSDSSADRAYVYEAKLKAYYLEPAAASSPSAPSGTVTDSQMPACTTEVSVLVELWQVPSGQPAWLCGGDVEFRIYADSDVPSGATSPPPLVDPVWQNIVRFTEATYGDGVTPSTQDVTTTPDVALSNGDYVLFVRASRDLPAGSQLYWSDWNVGEFTVDVDPPNTPTLAVAADDDEQCVDLTLTVATTSGYEDDSYEASVERSDDGGLTWTKVRGLQNVAVLIGTHALGADYEAPRGATVTYRARVSAELSGDGSRLWSDWDEEEGATNAALSWNIKVPEDPTKNWVRASVRVEPQMERDQEVAVLHPLDRQGAVALAAPASGETGTLAIYCHDTAGIVIFRALAGWEGALYLETPWGEARYIRTTSVTWVLGGMADDPWRTATVQYVEVGAPAVG